MEIPKTWSFNSDEVARNFDNHVREQLPWYDIATRLCGHIALAYTGNGGLIYDVGGSTGNLGREIKHVTSSRGIRYEILDCAESMERASSEFHFNLGRAETFDFKSHDVCVLFLTLMFVDVAERRAAVERMFEMVKVGGAMVVFDKVACRWGYLATSMRIYTIAEKVRGGASCDDAFKKETSLIGVQRPLDDGWIESVFPNAMQVFRIGEFAGWVIEKKEDGQ